MSTSSMYRPPQPHGNMTVYWQRYFAALETLPPGETFWLTSIQHPSAPPGDWRVGVVVHVNRDDAAKRLAEGTHRLSAVPEIEAEQARVIASEQACAEQERLLKNKSEEHQMAKAATENAASNRQLAEALSALVQNQKPNPEPAQRSSEKAK